MKGLSNRPEKYEAIFDGSQALLKPVSLHSLMKEIFQVSLMAKITCARGMSYSWFQDGIKEYKSLDIQISLVFI